MTLSPEIIAAARKGPAVHPATAPNLSKVRNIIAVGSGKGGVGKSTVTVNLAVSLARRGASVGILDADVYGPSQPGLLGAAAAKADTKDQSLPPLEAHGVKFMSVLSLLPDDGPVVWRAPMAVKLLQDFIAHVNWGELDYLLIDMPPGTGDVQLTMAQSAGLTGAVVVTTPQHVALGVASKGLKMFEQVKVPILGVVENMSGYVCTKCGHHEDIFLAKGGKALAVEARVPFLGVLPLDPAVVKSGDAGTPLAGLNSDSPAAKAYAELADVFEREVSRLNARDLGAPKNMALTAEGALEVTWPDGSVAVLEAYPLRLACPCASCVDEHSGKKILDANKVPLDVRVKEFHPVGHYGVAPRFSDTHSTGIYTFERLKKLSSLSKEGTALNL